jgi:hypothetical protein
MFINTLPNTLDTTVSRTNGTDTFIITGDIPSMWLRDSATQIMPYMRFVKDDPALRVLVRGLLQRHLHSVIIDPYANGFNFNGSGDPGPHAERHRVPPMTAAVWEGKWELDTLGAVLQLARKYWEATGDHDFFLEGIGTDAAGLTRDRTTGDVAGKKKHSTDDGLFRTGLRWRRAMTTLLRTLREQQQCDHGMPNAVYTNRTKPMPIYYEIADTEWSGGYPNSPSSYTGMIKCAFRPSDDNTIYPFVVPANALMVVELRHLSLMAQKLHKILLDKQQQQAHAQRRRLRSNEATEDEDPRASADNAGSVCADGSYCWHGYCADSTPCQGDGDGDGDGGGGGSGTNTTCHDNGQERVHCGNSTSIKQQNATVCKAAGCCYIDNYEYLGCYYPNSLAPTPVPTPPTPSPTPAPSAAPTNMPTPPPTPPTPLLPLLAIAQEAQAIASEVSIWPVFCVLVSSFTCHR